MRRDMGKSESLCDFFQSVALDDIAFLIFVEFAEADTAFEVGSNFVDFLVEAAEGGHSAVEHRDTTADDTGVSFAVHFAIGDEATSGFAFVDFENLAALGVTDHRLASQRI